ncbi:MFS transporter [Chloroflexota bacterium]
MASFLVPFMGSSINVALPSIGREMELDAILLSWVATSYLLAAAMFLVPFGRVADIYGRKKVFTLGMTIYTIASLLSGLSVTPTMLIAFRVLQGIGSSMVFGTGVAILTSVFPVGERGKALGINVAAVYLGLSLGPFIGGLLTQYLGWRSIFLINVPLGLLVITLVFLRLRGEWAEAKGEKLDVAGSVIYGLALLAIVYGFSLLPSTTGIWTILVGILGLVAFVLWERRVKSPVLNVKLFSENAVFALSNLAALINYSATFAVGFLLSLYLQYVQGFNPQTTGLILVAQPIVMTILSPFAGRLSDRIEPRIVASIGMASATIGLLLLIFLEQDSTIAFLLVSLVILGFGFALFSSPNTNAIMSSVEKRHYGVASATLGTMRLVGQVLSMGIAMLILGVYVGKVEISPEHHQDLISGLKVAFIIFASLCFVGIFASLTRGRVRKKA